MVLAHWTGYCIGLLVKSNALCCCMLELWFQRKREVIRWMREQGGRNMHAVAWHTWKIIRINRIVWQWNDKWFDSWGAIFSPWCHPWIILPIRGIDGRKMSRWETQLSRENSANMGKLGGKIKQNVIPMFPKWKEKRLGYP